MIQLPDTVLFDKRLVERHIAQGLITRKEVEKRLSEAEDLQDQADVLDLDELMAVAQGRAIPPQEIEPAADQPDEP